jgi:hypothetical protein
MAHQALKNFEIRIVEKAIAEVRVRNVPDEDVRMLETIAANMALTLSSFLRAEFKKIIRNAPSYLLKPRAADNPETLDEAIEALTQRRKELIELQQPIKKGPGRPKKTSKHNG